MGYYPILDHAPKGRDEGEAWQLWIRRHDEYQGERDAERGDPSRDARVGHEVVAGGAAGEDPRSST
jgi:hypothetical protein